MDFTFDRFYRLNRKAVLWAAFFGLIYLFRDFFTLIFLIFTISFLAYPPCRVLVARLRVTRVFAMVLVYGGILSAYVATGFWIIPALMRELAHLQGSLPEIVQSLKDLRAGILEAQPGLAKLTAGYISEERLDQIISQHHSQLRHKLPSITAGIVRFGLTLLIAIISSFFILLDAVRIQRQLKGLTASPLRDFYEETARPVVRFALVVGKAIQAQAMIAFTNTLLTVAGLWMMGIPSIAMLATIVFLGSFIPVIGVFISTAPIAMIALNTSGPGLALASIGFVCVVHFIEAYLLNPLIYGKHLKLNPVLVLIILYIGHEGFGFWGVMLGVPVTYYILHDVLGVAGGFDGNLRPTLA